MLNCKTGKTTALLSHPLLSPVRARHDPPLPRHHGINDRFTTGFILPLNDNRMMPIPFHFFVITFTDHLFNYKKKKPAFAAVVTY